MTNIAQFIQYRLAKFNSENILSFTRGGDDGATKVKKAMERVNRNLDKVSVLINDVEMDKSEIEKMKIQIPQAFKNSVKTYEATANHYWADGKLAKQVTFAIEIT